MRESEWRSGCTSWKRVPQGAQSNEKSKETNNVRKETRWRRPRGCADFGSRVRAARERNLQERCRRPSFWKLRQEHHAQWRRGELWLRPQHAELLWGGSERALA